MRIRKRLLVLVTGLSFNAGACDWLYQPAYQTRLAYLQNAESYNSVMEEFRIDLMTRERIAESIAAQKHYQSLGQYTSIQIGLMNAMIADAYLYQPDRGEYNKWEFREVSDDFANNWVRICKDRLWGR